VTVNIGHAIGLVAVLVGGALAFASTLGIAAAALWLVVMGIATAEANR